MRRWRGDEPAPHGTFAGVWRHGKPLLYSGTNRVQQWRDGLVPYGVGAGDVKLANSATTPIEMTNGLTMGYFDGSAAFTAALPGVNATTTPQAQGRCGHGPQLPMMLISPWANKNAIDSTPTDQTSIDRLKELAVEVVLLWAKVCC